MKNDPQTGKRPAPSQEAQERSIEEPTTMSLEKARKIMKWTSVAHAGLFRRLAQFEASHQRPR